MNGYENQRLLAFSNSNEKVYKIIIINKYIKKIIINIHKFYI